MRKYVLLSLCTLSAAAQGAAQTETPKADPAKPDQPAAKADIATRPSGVEDAVTQYRIQAAERRRSEFNAKVAEKLGRPLTASERALLDAAPEPAAPASLNSVDEAKRLEGVALEVRNRRMARQQTGGVGTATTPPPAGSASRGASLTEEETIARIEKRAAVLTAKAEKELGRSLSAEETKVVLLAARAPVDELREIYERARDAVKAFRENEAARPPETGLTEEEVTTRSADLAKAMEASTAKLGRALTDDETAAVKAAGELTFEAKRQARLDMEAYRRRLAYQRKVEADEQERLGRLFTAEDRAAISRAFMDLSGPSFTAPASSAGAPAGAGDRLELVREEVQRRSEKRNLQAEAAEAKRLGRDLTAQEKTDLHAKRREDVGKRPVSDADQLRRIRSEGGVVGTNSEAPSDGDLITLAMPSVDVVTAATFYARLRGKEVYVSKDLPHADISVFFKDRTAPSVVRAELEKQFAAAGIAVSSTADHPVALVPFSQARAAK